jgi:hypothetical protein
MQLGHMKGPEDLLDTFSSFHYTLNDASTFHLRLSIHSGLSSALPPSRPTSPLVGLNNIMLLGGWE